MDVAEVERPHHEVYTGLAVMKEGILLTDHEVTRNLRT